MPRLQRAALSRGSIHAANQGDPEAQFSLGLLCAAGEDVPQSDVEACRWLLLAVAGLPPTARHGTFARSVLRQIIATMIPLQVAEARLLAVEWTTHWLREHAEMGIQSAPAADSGIRL